jgi:subtilisin family serine protease
VLTALVDVTKSFTFRPISEFKKYNMRIITPFIATAFFASILTGCGTAQMVSTPINNIDKLPLKVRPLTDAQLKRWSHLDLVTDTVPGMSVDKAYAKLLTSKKPSTVIVGVIDSGVDIDHPDLKSVVWTNAKEIAGNKIDDDKNGFVDDIHGWNFLGMANDENLEITRLIKKGDDGSAAYRQMKADYDARYQEALGQKQQVDFIFNANKTIQTHLKKTNYTLQELNAITSTDPAITQSKMVMTQIIGQAGPEFNSELDAFKKQVYDQINFHYNLEHNGRKAVGDNPNDINDRNYGNNIVYGPDKEEALHGTHVAGIIAQIRGNNLGGDGVTNDVKIMAIRAVPNGDEYDKDIALAIRYAVDNGAKVINGSFGKSYSPNKQWVFDAIKYAASKDVLIVHAAGNDGKDIDVAGNSNYPNDAENNQAEIADNLITIGALNPKYGSDVVANFSNYGSINVDVFAPGVQIYATTPNNKYEFQQGTSMASPNAAGVAAMIRSYYPKLSASQVKKIMMDSGLPLTTEVTLGETSERRSFKNASKSGKIVNAYNALIMAEAMSKK